MRRNTSACGILAAWMLLLPAVPAWAEDITVTTYYPSPRGVYDELRTSGDVGIGTIGAVTERLQVEGGDLYVVTGDIGIGTQPNFGGGALQLPVTGAVEFVGGGRITSSPSKIEIGTNGLSHDLKVWGSEQVGGLLSFDDGAGNFDVELTHGTAPRTLQLGRAGLPNSLLVNTNTLLVDGPNNRVGIGTAAPQAGLHVVRAGAPQVARFDEFLGDPSPTTIGPDGTLSVGNQLWLMGMDSVASSDLHVSGGTDGVFYILNRNPGPTDFPQRGRIALVVDPPGAPLAQGIFLVDYTPSGGPPWLTVPYGQINGNFYVNDPGDTNTLAIFDTTTQPGDPTVLFKGNVTIGTAADKKNLTVNGEATIGGVANDGTGKVVCIKAGKTLGTCDNAPDTNGICFCQ